MPESFRLLPGLRLVRRDADHVQLGVDPPRCAVLRDLPEVRRLVADLAVGNRPPAPDAEAGRALAAIVDAGLLVPDDSAVRRARLAAGARTRRRGARRRDGRDGAAGGGRRPPVDPARWPGCGPGRERRRGARAAGSTRWSGTRCRTCWSATTARGRRGPVRVPGRTACLRCVDCHLGDADPRRGLVVEQAATQAPLVAAPVDATLRAVALSLAVRDLVTFVEGDRPATWSATLTVEPYARPRRRRAGSATRLRLRVGTRWPPTG